MPVVWIDDLTFEEQVRKIVQLARQKLKMN